MYVFKFITHNCKKSSLNLSGRIEVTQLGKMVGLLAELTRDLSRSRCLGSVSRVKVALLSKMIGLLAELAGSELCIGRLSTLAEEALLADVVGLLAMDALNVGLLGRDLLLEGVDLSGLGGDHIAKSSLLSLTILLLESLDLVDLGGKQHANDVLLSFAGVKVGHMLKGSKLGCFSTSRIPRLEKINLSFS